MTERKRKTENATRTSCERVHSIVRNASRSAISPLVASRRPNHLNKYLRFDGHAAVNAARRHRQPMAELCSRYTSTLRQPFAHTTNILLCVCSMLHVAVVYPLHRHNAGEHPIMFERRLAFTSFTKINGRPLLAIILHSERAMLAIVAATAVPPMPSMTFCVWPFCATACAGFRSV